MADPVTVESQETVESNVLKHAQAQKHGNKEHDGQEEDHIIGKGFRRLVRSGGIDAFMKMFFVLLSVPWLISTIFFSIFDTKCIVLEQASVLNCSQDFFIENPKHWIFAWLLMSIISSFFFVIIVCLNQEKVNYQREKAKKIYHKGSFGSLMFLLVVTSGFNLFRVFTTTSNTTAMFVSILVFLWSLVTAVVVCCLNYLPRVHWKNTGLPRCTLVWWKDSLGENSNFIIYWLALLVYFVEVTCKLIANMLDVAHEVAPLIQSKFPEESGQFRGVMALVIGFRLAFHVRLLSFFWQKIFHGEKDLFSEPSIKLVEEPLSDDQRLPQQQDQLRKTVQLEDITCT